MWFRNLTLYRLPSLPYTLLELNALLSLRRAPDGLGSGWIPDDYGNYAYEQQNHFMLSLHTARPVLPAAVVKREVLKRIEEFKRTNGFKPNAKVKREIKEDAISDLIPRAFVVTSVTRGWIDTFNGTLAVDTSSQPKADAFVVELIRSFAKPLDIEPMRTARNVVEAMTAWVIGEPTDQFTVDQDTTLAGAGRSKATVKYANQTLESADVKHHIEGGKRVTSLAMTYEDRVSFVLDADLKIRRVSALDLLMQSEKDPDDTARAADFVLMTMTLSNLIADLVESLGGYYVAPAEPEADADVSDDELYGEAVKIVRNAGRASVSLVQRHLRIGYNRAARLLEEMETAGIVSAMNSSGSRLLVAAPATADA